MKAKILQYVFFLCVVLPSLPSIAADNELIQIPSGCYFAETLLYLAYHLKVNLIYTNTDNQLSKSFVGEILDPKKTIESFQEANKDVVDIWYDSEYNSMICTDKRVSEKFQKLMSSKISLHEDGNLYVLIGKKQRRFGLTNRNGSYVLKRGKNNEISIMLSLFPNRVYPCNDFIKIFSADTTVKQLLLGLVSSEKFPSSCHIYLKIPMSASQKADEKRIAEELQKEIEAIESGATTTTTREELALLKDSLAAMRTPVPEEDCYEVDIGMQIPKDWEGPTYEQIADLLKKPRKTLGQAPYQHILFFFYKAIEYDTINFIDALLQYKVFDNDPILCNVMPNSYMVPGAIVRSKNYEAVKYLLKNLDSMKSYKMKELIIRAMSKIDKSHLDEDTRDIFLRFAKEFKLEEIYADTSKWVGDDLPEDYDRWQNFKVSETELVFECDKAIATTKYHLKFFKYKEPIKIGGIPLKKMEEADYSTPEKAYFSTCSERTYEWSKTSVYDIANYNEDDFSLYNQWKDWHSGFDPFILILYKVEISQIGNKKKDSPDLFLVIKVLNDANRIAAIPMKLDGKKWKFYLCWPRDAEILSGYIREEISKTISKIKDGK